MSNLATIVNNILADSGIDDINVVVTTGSYTNPSWIVSLPWTKITGTPTTLAGYGITNAYTKTETDTLLNAKLSLSGGTMTGPINLFASQFYEGGGLFALNANNSDLIGLNGIYFNDFADSPWEGLNWYNTATTWDSLFSASGVLYYTPNRASTTIGTSYTVYHSGNLSSPVTGTGANTRIAYWTGSGTLSGEDAFAYDATNNRVRINASAFDSAGVAAKLIVNGVLSAGSDATVQIDGFIRIKDQLLIHNAANTVQDAYIQAVGAGVLTIGNKLLINTSSIVGAYQLDVNGTVRFYNNTTSEQGLTIENQGIGDAGINIFAGTGKRVTQRYHVGNVAKWGLFVNDSAIGTDTFGIYNYANGTFALSFGTNGTARFSGTITGGANLELTNAGGSYVLIGEGTGVNQYGAIDWDATNNRLRIATQPYAFGANGGQITLTTTGLVGIGILAPSYKLDVNGGVNNDQARFVAASGDALVRIIANNYGTEADARLFLGENDTLGMTFEYDGQNNIGHIGMNDSVDPTGAFSKRISMPRAGTDTIFGSGNVLIGTSSPNGATLQVNGTATVSSTLNASGLITSNSGFRTNALNGYVLRNDGNNLNLGGLTRRGFWAGDTAADTQIFAETGFGIFLNPGGSASSGLTLASTGEATFSRPLMTTQSNYAYQNIIVNTGFGGGYTSGTIQSLLAGYDTSIYGVDIGYSYDGSGYSLRFATNDNTSGNPIERLRIDSTGGATFSSTVSATQYTARSTGGSGLRIYGAAGTNQWDMYLNGANLRFSDNTGTGSVVFDRPLNGTTASFTGVFELNTTGTGALGFFGANNTTDKYFRIRNSSGNFEMGTSSTEHYLIGNGAIPLKFFTNGTPRLTLDGSTGIATFSNAVGIGASPANTMLQVQGDWVSGFSTVRVQGSSANQAGYGLYNIAGARVGVWAYTGSVIYLETETSGINMNFNPAGITSMTLEGNGNVSIGRLTSGVTRSDIYLSPSSTNAELYFGRLSGTNGDNTRVYFQNRVGNSTMFVDTGAQRVQIKSATTPNYTAYDLFVSRGDQYGGGIDVQSGLVRFRGDDDWLYINRAGTDVITIDNNNRVGIGTTSNNGKLQITGSHVGGYGMLNMNSADSCIIAMDSSTSWDVRLRYKFQGVDYWFAGMQDSNVWRLSKGDNTAVLYATQGNNVYIPNGGLQIASEGGFTGSAKFLVGSFLSAGSGAIAQFNGFLRIRDQILIHRDSNTAQETYLQCTGSAALTTGGSITATSFFESSDVRLKTNIADYNPVNISDIAAKIYEKDGKLEIGYLAQDLQGVINSAVSERENGYLDLSYRQVHTAKIAALEAKIKELEKQLNNK